MNNSSRMMRLAVAGAISAVGLGLMVASWTRPQQSTRAEDAQPDQSGHSRTPAARRDAHVRLVGHDEFVGGEEVAPFVPYNPVMCGVDSRLHDSCGEPTWDSRQPIQWQSVFAQGGYIGPARTQHVAVYRFRVGDVIGFFYRITREETSEYRLNVGDELRVEAPVEADFDRQVTVQQDGMIYLPYVGGVRASNRTVKSLQDDLVQRYKEYYKHSTITVTPIRTNTKLDDLRSVVDSRAAVSGGQGVQETVAPDGSISLPSLGRVAVQGLTLEELMQEVNHRYAEIVEGLEVTPALRTPAPRMAYVLGEVPNPGAVSLDRPTTAMMAIAQAGGWRPGGNLRQIVIFRRTADWRLIATKLDLQGALWGKSPAPSDEIWLRDSDIVLIPKSPIQIADDYINLIFTQGIYGVFPNQGWSLNSTL